MRRPLLLLVIPGVLAAQAATPAIPTANPDVRAAMERLPAINAWILDKQAALCRVASPPFKEAARAAAFRRELVAIGYTDARIDSLGDVIAELRGGDGPTVMIAGHLDTVFPEGTAVAVKRSGTRMDGPGIGDDCRGLAVVLAVARVFRDQKITPRGRILFVGNLGEEGPGNSRGVRWLLEREFKGRVDYFVSVDGAGSDITSRAVGSHRYTVTVSGPGGHSYGDFGVPNPVHALGRAIARIGDLTVPASPRTTFSVGVIRGGTSVNSIAMKAQMDIDMRSESPDALADLDRRMHAAVAAAVDDEQKRWPNSRVQLAGQVRHDRHPSNRRTVRRGPHRQGRHRGRQSSRVCPADQRLEHRRQRADRARNPRNYHRRRRPRRRRALPGRVVRRRPEWLEGPPMGTPDRGRPCGGEVARYNGRPPDT